MMMRYKALLAILVVAFALPAQAADPTVLPADEEMQSVAYDAMDQFLTRRLASNN